MEHNELTTTSNWQVEIAKLSSLLITSAFVDTRYLDGDTDELTHQSDTIYKLYLDRACTWKDFFIENILEDIQDHDENILEEMADIIIKNGLGDYTDSETYSDIYSKVMSNLSEDYQTYIWIDYPITGLENIPLFVSSELKRRGAYYEIEYPHPGSWQAYRGEPKQTIGYNDCQNILFEGFINYDEIWDPSKNDTIDVPVIVRPYYDNNQQLLGGE